MTTATKPAQSLLAGVCITVKWLGPTNHRGPRYKATYRRDSDQVFTATVDFHSGREASSDAARRAAQEVVNRLNKWVATEFPELAHWQLCCHGWDHENYFFIANNPEL